MSTEMPRVLIAEDDPALRAMIAARLRADGCNVIEAENGDVAIDRLDDSEEFGQPLDLVVMDVRMPGVSGIEIAHLIRAWRWTTPVVLVTAYPEPELYDEAARLGATVLAKPFAFAKLSDAAMWAVKGKTP